MVIGLLLIIKPESTLTLISCIIGAFLLCVGIINGIKYFTKKDNTDLTDLSLIIAIIGCIAGIVFITVPEFLASIIPFVIGIVIIIKSIIRIQISLNLKRNNKDTWVYSLITSLIGLALGLVLFLNPFGGAVLMTQIVGIFMVVYAISDLIEFKTVNKMLDDGVEFIK